MSFLLHLCNLFLSFHKYHSVESLVAFFVVSFLNRFLRLPACACLFQTLTVKESNYISDDNYIEWKTKLLLEIL